MYEFYDMHGMHGGWGLGAFGLLLPLLMTVLWLAPFVLLFWLTRHAILGHPRHDTPAPQIETASAVELLSQRYVRGEIDITTFESMLDELASGGHPPAQDREAAAAEGHEDRTLHQFRPRADVPIDWS